MLVIRLIRLGAGTKHDIRDQIRMLDVKRTDPGTSDGRLRPGVFVL